VSWRPVALAGAVAAAGAAGTLAVGAALGMGGPEILRLGALLVPAALVTVAAAVAARHLMARASFTQALVAVAIIAAVAGLANLWALAELMFVSAHDAGLVAALILYSVGAGVGSALVLARSSTRAVARLNRTAGELAEGNLDARVGALEAGPELGRLAETLDEMSRRLQVSIEKERLLEARRRDLITAVSHDLRTPLAGLRAMAEAIEDRVVDDPETLRKYVAEMRVSVESLSELVDDLFELTQLEAGRIETEDDRARLGDVVQSAMAACRAEGLEKGLVFEERLDGAGDEMCSPRLVRVLQNLLQNAIRHTPADGTVRIEAHRRESAIEIAVEDDGEGVPSDSRDRVFEPFWRGDWSRSTHGAGLGLTLAKRIVDTLGGEIGVESGAHGGARFSVLIPA
jgi:signal transduction histidine kinase